MDVSRSPRPQRQASDLVLLAFMAEHRLIFATHAATLLGISVRAARTRLAALQRDGLVQHSWQYPGLSRPHRITRAGLARIESRLAEPKDAKPGQSRHDDGLAWLWLAARAGAWGPLREVVSERTMRSHDARLDGFGRTEGPDAPGLALAEPPFGVRLYMSGLDGRERRHYPDLLLVTPTGKRIAVELELTTKEPARREAILAAYDGDPRIAGVLYLVDNPAIGRALEASARRIGLRVPLSIQNVAWPERAARGGRERAAERRGSERQRERAAERRGSEHQPERRAERQPERRAERDAQWEAER